MSADEKRQAICALVKAAKAAKRYHKQASKITFANQLHASVGADANFVRLPADTDPIGQVRDYVRDCPLLNTTALVSTECQCELRYAQHVTEETLDRIEDGNLDLAEKPFAPSSIFLASASTAAMDQ